MSTVFGALDANDESQRRVPSPWVSPAWGPAVRGVLNGMSRDLRDGTWDPIGDDLRRLAENKTSRED